MNDLTYFNSHNPFNKHVVPDHAKVNPIEDLNNNIKENITHFNNHLEIRINSFKL